MVRAPCCEKMGLKKGPWTPEEDQILISYIQKHGHGNWRALPKQAGLLRCGKSCRLRWTNYLRPDIKRGNFTKEEEDTIIQLHEMLGNRWSAIAARLPGRTDNEIKNVWHTHLKKKLKDYQPPHSTKRHSEAPRDPISSTSEPENSNVTNIQHVVTSPARAPSSPQGSSSEMSSVSDSSVAMGVRIEAPKASYCVPINSKSSCSQTTYENNFLDTSYSMIKQEDIDSLEYFPQIDESFWTEDVTNFPWVAADELQFEYPPSLENCTADVDMMCQSKTDDATDFWYNVFIRAGDLPELPQF